jgi:ribonuclease HII
MNRKRQLLPIPTLEFEKHLWKAGFTRIAGIDEAGRGAWAGPVVAAVVILPVDPSLTSTLDKVRDSKLMTPVSRETWSVRIKDCAICWGVGVASSGEIDARGIVPATKLACERALAGLHPDYLLTDYLLFREMDLPQTALVKGDQRSLSVAAASVLAKTSRDVLMRELDDQFPGYNFARHKGYGTPQHAEALMKLNRCGIHRVSFSIP